MQLYQQAFPLVAKYVRDRGGSFEQAKDIFQDALVIYYEKIITSDLRLSHSERSYILGIVKHLWAKQFKQPHDVALDESMTGIAMEEDTGIGPADTLIDLLQSSGKKCMELLRLFITTNCRCVKLPTGSAFPVSARPLFRNINASKK
ncbi:RNA polymerase sigma factor [Longitalea luteola]|uniref:RNA polymerase sigma factor n=1 Tax=Longitalea luteola TaxID=2812563 RepID=UPI001A961151|nr:sigma-70 family RNA polymerase sigma factor [Longitalea luteola]